MDVFATPISAAAFSAKPVPTLPRMVVSAHWLAWLTLRDHGPVLYAILNSRGSVNAYRRWQDNFLKDLIEESGGLGEYLPAHDDADRVASAWMPSEYWGSLTQAPERRAVVRKAKSTSVRKYGRTRRSTSRSRT